jgi:hypothetical protein
LSHLTSNFRLLSLLLKLEQTKKVYIGLPVRHVSRSQLRQPLVDTNMQVEHRVEFFFHIHTVLLRLDIIKVFYSPTDAQVNCLKNNFKIYIKIDIKTAPTCFGAITIITERTIRSC